MNKRVGQWPLSASVIALAWCLVLLGSAVFAADDPVPTLAPNSAPAPAPDLQLLLPDSVAPVPSDAAKEAPGELTRTLEAADAPAGVTPASVMAAIPPVEQLPSAGGPAGKGADAQTVSLRVDGNLAGLVTILDAYGHAVPVQVTVALVRDGKVVASVRSDDTGAFQFVGLAPGVYSVIASGTEGFAALSIRVVPFDPEAKQNDLLYLSLVPFSDYQLGKDLAGDDAPEDALAPMNMPMMEGQPAYGGGGGGGGGALLPLLGLGGLAGLGGIGGGGGGGGWPVSPYTPP
jgi:hypothetical protein